ncbi:type II secretion system protein [Clostridium sp. LP20]|uniref:type II secretion system protein n=1 Tax=Clostridium sp. LP20 TaxID=3418665 RepID=UPI003EE74022
MKKKGYTLVELIAVMSILAILFSIGIGGYGLYKNINNDNQINYALYEIEDTLSYGELYCRNNKKEGIFYLEEKEGTLTVGFKVRAGENIKEVVLPKVIEIVKDNKDDSSLYKSIKINKDGNMQSDTVKLMDLRGNEYRLTIRVSVNLITIWGWDMIYEKK